MNKKKLRSLLAKLSPQDEARLLAKNLSDDIKEIESKIPKNLVQKDYTGAIQNIQLEIGALKESILEKLSTLPDQASFEEIKKKYLEDIRSIENQFNENLDHLESDILVTNSEVAEIKLEAETQIEDLKKLVQKIKIDLSQRGGGSMNRQIVINNVDPLTRYTDINLKAGTNVTITYQNNDQTKKVDVTITASGGGSGGITRSINNTVVDLTAGATPGTDYVYLCAGTVTITMPSAIGNTNLYTIKNVGAGVVTVVSADTIDGAATQVMPVQFTSIDLVSNSAAWVIT